MQIFDAEKSLLSNFKGASLTFRVSQILTAYVDSSEAEINSFNVSFNGNTIYSTLPDVAFIPNYCVNVNSCVYTITIESTGSTLRNDLNSGSVYVNKVKVLSLIDGGDRELYVNAAVKVKSLPSPFPVIQLFHINCLSQHLKYVIVVKNIAIN